MPGEHITIEVNGREADQAAVSLLEHEGWGHFTAMQVRGGRVRGLGLHLSRLEAAHAPVSRVDDMMISQDEAFTGLIAAAIDGCPWDEI